MMDMLQVLQSRSIMDDQKALAVQAGLAVIDDSATIDWTGFLQLMLGPPVPENPLEMTPLHRNKGLATFSQGFHPMSMDDVGEVLEGGNEGGNDNEGGGNDNEGGGSDDIDI